MTAPAPLPGEPTEVQAVLWDAGGEAEAASRRTIAGVTQSDRMEKALRRAGVSRIHVWPAGRLPPAASTDTFRKFLFDRLAPEVGRVISLPASFLASPGAVAAFVRDPLADGAAGRRFSANETSALTDFPICLERKDAGGGAMLADWSPPQGSWHAFVRRDGDIPKVENQLFSTVFKPHEEFIGRLNRRMSIPISRRLVRLPVPPNLVTVVSFLVSLAAGYFFSFGTYGACVLGAALSTFSTVLDGCDGEIARVKMQESAFGCWLETVADYLYYVAVFGGLSLGMARAHGPAFLWIGGSLLAGVVLTCLLFLNLRRHLSRDGRPGEFKNRLFVLIEASPPRLRKFMARSYPLMIRPSISLFGFLAALANLLPAFLVFYAAGTQLAWMFGLYLHRLAYAPPADGAAGIAGYRTRRT